MSAEFSPGMPVEVGDIDRQLGLLWEQSDAAKARASLVNLVIYSEAQNAIETNTKLLEGIATRHAFRALLVQGNPQAPHSAVHAWITAHCHAQDADRKEICSEQITFRLDGPSAGLLPSTVFSHLDSDLPLYLWWQGELPQEPDPQLWSFVDRLIVDSSSWTRAASQFRVLQQIRDICRGAVCDLTWTRLFHMFYALAQLFDYPAALSRIGQVQKIEMEHAPGQRVTALELLGWLASRFRWVLDWEGDRPVFRRPDGGSAGFELREVPAGASCLAGVRFDFGDATGSVCCRSGGEFYLAEFQGGGAGHFAQMLPAGKETACDLLLLELSRSSRHPLFWPAVRAIEPLLQDI